MSSTKQAKTLLPGEKIVIYAPYKGEETLVLNIERDENSYIFSFPALGSDLPPQQERIPIDRISDEIYIRSKFTNNNQNMILDIAFPRIATISANDWLNKCKENEIESLKEERYRLNEKIGEWKGKGHIEHRIYLDEREGRTRKVVANIIEELRNDGWLVESGEIQLKDQYDRDVETYEIIIRLPAFNPQRHT